ncbi:hypothetical protein BDZ90DRAFT_231519 [Jaminaea rosea]|uniref:Uncharacterized protein n=1 Tax=Jaminaea rosea TaxID=1569628 RepID=A0A316UTB5_9BASI|nr:hypothetical protein BDZ90DRAFT_231519 [Jaminaea rosea]PWN28536.1 hypothetical protein BDZ90DRAFT_231519 [Jaminaea rosea]
MTDMQEGQSGTSCASSMPSSSSSSSRILVLSPFAKEVPLPSLEHLVRSITAGNDDEEEEAGVNDAASADAEDARQLRWTIDNRYYTAEVHFRLVALDLGEPRRIRRRAMADSRNDDEASASVDRLRQELDGVPAVVLVMPGRHSVTAHGKVLAQLQEATSQQDETQQDDEEEASMPMGFELGASVVVCLPKVMQQADHGVQGNGSKSDEEEQLRDLYAENGWECIDLARDLGVGEDGEEDDAGSEGDDGNEEGENEAQGLKRVREALEAHMWPGLQRKGPSSSRELGGTASAALARSVTQRGDQDADIDEALRRLDLDLPPELSSQTASSTSSTALNGLLSADRDPLMGAAAGHSSSSATGRPDSSAPIDLLDVQPTVEDEELARKFLAQINDLEQQRPPGESNGAGEASTAPESEEVRRAKQEEALRRLEEFLESEDATWGRARDGANVEEEEDGLGTAAARPSALHFEDDFDDFVTPPTRDRLSTSENVEDDDDDEEILAAAAFGGTANFEGSLHQLRLEAERVRGMPGDREAKEKEAEDVVRRMLEGWNLDG